jgi:hypothetical protein
MALFRDNLSAAAAGRPALPSIDTGGVGPIHTYTLAGMIPGTPDQAVVYRVDQALAPSADAVGRAFGVTFKPQADPDGSYSFLPSSLYYSPASGTIQYSGPAQRAGAAEPRFFPRSITDQASAIAMAEDLLAARGLFTRTELAAMQASADRFSYPETGNGPFWSIRFVRMLGGAPCTDGVSMQVLEAGEIDGIYISHSPIGGSEPGSLVGAAYAWQQVIQGHWYLLSGLMNYTLANFPSFRANQVELCYQPGPGSWLIPMWCFIDNTTLGVGFEVTLTYPALAPGTFDWTVPNHD